MKLLCVTLMQSCNYNCPNCTLKDWIYPLDKTQKLFSTGEDKPVNCITNEALLKWLDAYILPVEWFIKITGGEPGLYPEIGELIPALERRGYRGYIETNGSLPIPKSNNFPRLAAWHTGKPKPEYFDAMLIIEDPLDNWEAKVRHCVASGIKYYRTILRGINSTVPLEERVRMDKSREPSKFDGLLMMYSQGQLMTCPGSHAIYGDIWQMAVPRSKPLSCAHCLRCPQTFMADIFYDREALA